MNSHVNDHVLAFVRHPHLPDGNVTFFVCETCGTTIPMEYVSRHNQWHERLRRAVEENEFLE